MSDRLKFIRYFLDSVAQKSMKWEFIRFHISKLLVMHYKHHQNCHTGMHMYAQIQISLSLSLSKYFNFHQSSSILFTHDQMLITYMLIIKPIHNTLNVYVYTIFVIEFNYIHSKQKRLLRAEKNADEEKINT